MGGQAERRPEIPAPGDGAKVRPVAEPYDPICWQLAAMALPAVSLVAGLRLLELRGESWHYSLSRCPRSGSESSRTAAKLSSSSPLQMLPGPGRCGGFRSVGAAVVTLWLFGLSGFAVLASSVHAGPPERGPATSTAGSRSAAGGASRSMTSSPQLCSSRRIRTVPAVAAAPLRGRPARRSPRSRPGVGQAADVVVLDHRVE